MKRFNGFKKFTIPQLLSISINTFFQYFFNNKFKSAFKIDSVIEDVFYGVLVPSKFKNYRVSNISEALKFSFDESPHEFFEMNNCQLPIGCHAFIRYYYGFWIKHIW
jgi:hypothetical protein